MPSHKVLVSVVRGVAESFTSLMNYANSDYVMGHLVRAAWDTGATEIQVDLLTGRVSASPLAVVPVLSSLTRQAHLFPDVVARSGSSMAFIHSAYLRLTVDPAVRRRVAGSGFSESPFTCTVALTDDRQKPYTHSISAWWYPESPAV